jgi:hypothetical protein
MARLCTLLDLISDLEQRADIQADQQFTQAEKVRLINQAITKFWDLLVRGAPPDYFLTKETITTTPGLLENPLPATFYKMRRVQVDESNGRRRSLDTMQPDDRIVLQPPVDVQTIHLEFIPAAPLLVQLTDTFDGVNGWEEVIVLEAAAKVYRKKNLDPASLNGELADERNRLTRMAYRDAGTPPTLTRVRNRGIGWPWSSNALTHYRIVGQNLEIYRRNTLAPYP